MKFREDGTFHIIQFADIQEIPVVSEDTLTLMRRVLDKTRPDLVVLTGDQLKGYSRAFRVKQGRIQAKSEAVQREELTEKIRNTIRTIMEPVTSRGIPFAVTFGNHDEQCGLSNKEQMELYRELPGCIDWLNNRGHQVLRGPEAGTFALGIDSSDETRTAMAVYLFDSHGDAPGGGYRTLHPTQLYWYKAARDTFAQENQGMVPGIVFQHIPLPEYYRLLSRADRKTKGSVRTYRTHSREYYILNREKCGPEGALKEAVSIPDGNEREYDILREKGDIFAVYCGHDHKNSFAGRCGTMDLGYTPTCGFHDYGDGVNRAAREFVFYEQSPSSYRTRLLSYKQLVGARPSNPLQDLVYSHFPATVEEAVSLGKTCLLGAGLALAGIGTAMLVQRKQ